MNKHFLVTISNDIENLSGVEFLCSFFKKESEHNLTLLHIYRLDATDMKANLMDMWEKPDDKIKGSLTIGARKAIDKSTQLISTSRMSIDKMETKTVGERFGKVRDILSEGAEGLYDAIILGKRASYALQWLFDRPADEIAQSILKDSNFTTPVWICPKTEVNRKNVLLCVDGSDNSFRAVDHVGFILSRQDQHAVTLVHVKDGTGPESHQIFSRAEKLLHHHKISDKRIETVSTWGFSVTGTIQGILDRHHHAAVAVGLHGNESGVLREFNLAGDTTSKLISKIENASIWCCP